MDRSKWEYKKLGEVCTIIGRIGFRGYTKADFVNNPEEGAITLSPSNIVKGEMDFSNCSYITWQKYEESPEIKIYPGDILLVKTASVGKTALVKSLPHEATINPQFVVLKNIVINNHYLSYCLKSNKAQDYILSMAKGAVAQTVTQRNLAEMQLAVPSIEDQQRIVTELDCLNEMIAVKQEQLKEFDKLAQSIFFDMFGDPVNNEKHFPLQSIDDVIKFEGGSQPARSFFEYEPTDDNIRLIQIRDYKTDAYITYIPKKMARRFCEEDDIMIGRYGPPIFQILKGLKGAYNVALMKAVPKKGNKEFIRAFLKQDCLLHHLENFSRRVAGQDGIQMDELKAYPFPYPPLALQQQFAEKIQAIEAQKELVKQSIAETQHLLDYTMDKYFG